MELSCRFTLPFAVNHRPLTPTHSDVASTIPNATRHECFDPKGLSHDSSQTRAERRKRSWQACWVLTARGYCWGHRRANGWVRLKPSGDQINILSDLALQHVNIRALFEQFEDFGQKSILSNNLKGFANINLHFESLFETNFKIVPSSVNVRSEIDITNSRCSGIIITEYVQMMKWLH